MLVMAFAGVRLVGLTPYAVLSGSMEPQYPTGSLIYVKDVDPSTIVPGDAVTFVTPSGQTATHQAYEVDAAGRVIRTQGIANINQDGSIMHDAEPVQFSQVVGVPVACIPLLGYINAFCATPPGSYVVLALAVAIVAVPFVRPPSRNGGNREPMGRHAA